jgi:uncharacterized membrane protein YeaQ/YmgE (transglycosylase-associated protein family)
MEGLLRQLMRWSGVVDMAKEEGIGILASFIVGLPGETVATMRHSMEFAQGLKASYGLSLLFNVIFAFIAIIFIVPMVPELRFALGAIQFLPFSSGQSTERGPAENRQPHGFL